MNNTSLFKSKKWLQAQNWADNLRDHLGNPLDPQIIFTVIVFRYLDIHTTMSCEGHLDGGFAAPWAMVLSPKGDAIEQKVFDYLSKHRSKELPQKLRKQRIDVVPHNFKYSKLLFWAVEEFYKVHKTSFSNRLVLCWETKGELRLISQGAWLNEYEPLTKKKQNLYNFRKEMLAFSRFLLSHHKIR